jgi:hypothetical protein
MIVCNHPACDHRSIRKLAYTGNNNTLELYIFLNLLQLRQYGLVLTSCFCHL